MKSCFRGVNARRWSSPSSNHPVTLSGAYKAKVMRLLMNDVTTTMGAADKEAIREFSVQFRDCEADPARYRQTVIEEVQRYIHDLFIDTTRPRCPTHPNHPLWLHDGHWICEKDRVVVARLGELRVESGRRGQ